jgi:hypothetical protein
MPYWFTCGADEWAVGCPLEEVAGLLEFLELLVEVLRALVLVAMGINLPSSLYQEKTQPQRAGELPKLP